MALLTADLVGKTLANRYEILELDHEELLGAVYTAHDLDTQRRASVKVLHPHLTEDREKFKRFGREITATYMVSQQNTVEVTDWGEEGDVHYLVMEYLRARSLADELEKGPMKPDRVASITIQVARAIGAAHQEGIVHRALGPHNVLLLDNADGGDFVKVRDFGLSKLEKIDDEETGLTTKNTRVGNAEYMAPEYIKTSKYHTKGDLYALGALTYHMLVGKPPFTGGMLEVLSAHVSSIPPAPSSAASDVPAWMDELVAGLLLKTPEERPGAYRVVQTIESQAGAIEAPDLFELDENGEIIVPAGPPMLAMALGTALLLLLLGALVVVGAIVVFALVVMVSLGG